MGPAVLKISGLPRRRERKGIIKVAWRAKTPKCLMTKEAKSVYFALLRGACSETARWQSGDAADCKSVYAGSIPTRASNFFAK